LVLFYLTYPAQRAAFACHPCGFLEAYTRLVALRGCEEYLPCLFFVEDRSG
jgi:hypothetical protein